MQAQSLEAGSSGALLWMQRLEEAFAGSQQHEQAKDLILQLLQPDPTQRLTLKQALQSNHLQA